MTIQEQITAAAGVYGVPETLALSVARAESNFNQAAISRAGAVGVFQLMPATAAALGVNPYNLAENIDGGVRYLAQQLAAFGNNVSLALAAYNWGPNHVTAALSQWGPAWLYHAPVETRNYIAGILGAVAASPVAVAGVGLAAALVGLALLLVLLD